MDSNLINAIADLVRYVTPIVVIFGFLSFALKFIFDTVSGGRIK